MRDWNDFNKFGEADEKYLPIRGEGDTKATQITTAISKLVYKWFNDGDIFDNTGRLTGWGNDLSTFANWLYKYCPEAKAVFDEKWKKYEMTETSYVELLYELCERCQTIEFLKTYEVPKEGSVYEEKGPFRFEEPCEEEDEEDEEGWW